MKAGIAITKRLVLSLMMAVVLFMAVPMTGFEANAASAKPGGIYSIKATRITSETATLKWGKAKGSVSGYAIFRNGKLIKYVNAKTFSYKDSKLKYATKYKYYVKAYKLTGKKVKQYYNKQTKKWQSKAPAKKYLGKTRLINGKIWGAASQALTFKTLNADVICGVKVTPSMCPKTFVKAGTKCKICGQGQTVKIVYKNGKYTGTITGVDYSKKCHHHNTFKIHACAGDANHSISEAKTKCRWFAVNGGYEIDPKTGKQIGTQTMDIHSDTFRNASLTELNDLTYEELAGLYPSTAGDGEHTLCQSNKTYVNYWFCKDCKTIILK